jgi:hypothetical protein
LKKKGKRLFLSNKTLQIWYSVQKLQAREGRGCTSLQLGCRMQPISKKFAQKNLAAKNLFIATKVLIKN